jgi:hypothetical protein
MKAKMYRMLPVLLALSSVASFAQNNCSGSLPTGTCPVVAPPVQVWCAGNNLASTCPGGTSKVGFFTSAPAAGSWSGQFEGLDAKTILADGGTPRSQADPVGAVGPTNSSGVGQYLEIAGGLVQAFDRKTGNGIISHSANSGAVPQPLTGLFAPGGKNYCGAGTADAIATYDRIDSVFVLANTFNPGNAGTYYYCIGVSTAAGGVPADNLEGSNNESLWNVYAYELNPSIPKNKNGQTYFPDYQRFGTWSDGFYVAWDLEDPETNDVNIVGFMVCKLDKADILAGLSSNAPACYTYIPSYVPTTNASLIHTLLPADFEGSTPIPSTTKGEYFLAQVNPSNPGTNNQCTSTPCTSNELAYWTWSAFTSGAGPTLIPLNDPFTPACYTPQRPWNTVCVQEPYGGYSDSVGDRLMYRLAYRYFTGTGGGEYLAVAHTIQEDATTERTGIRYYQILAGASPTIAAKGDVTDNTYHLSAYMPSVAMDHNGNVGITFTVAGIAGISSFNYDPSPVFLTSTKGKLGPVELILSKSGTTGQDETDTFWGEYVSVASDPNDDLTFWATDEYMNGNQTSNCSGSGVTGCTWATRVYTCKKGSGC